jgi:hypothetical protein
MFYTEIVVFVVLSIENVGIEYSFTRKEVFALHMRLVCRDSMCTEVCRGGFTCDKYFFKIIILIF